jgi:hypothetical protein
MANGEVSAARMMSSEVPLLRVLVAANQDMQVSFRTNFLFKTIFNQKKEQNVPSLAPFFS